MPYPIGDLVDAINSTVHRVGRFCNWAANISSAPGAVPQDLWEIALRSLLQHLDDPRLKKPYLITLVDFRLEASTTRLWTVDVRTKRIEISSVVSHGRGSGARDVVTQVSNTPGSNMSSVGAFITGATITSTAGSREHSQRRIALEVIGLDSTNDNALRRRILFHGAWYVNASRAGHSEGCFATEQSVNDRLVQLIGGGSFVYSYLR